MTRPQWAERFYRSRYWNPDLERMPRERLDRWHLGRLRALTRYAWERSRFYRRRLEEAGVHPDGIRSLDDFKRRVPLTDKSDFLELQEEEPPYGPTGAVGEEEVHMHCETSGTTGIPLRIPYTMYDTERYGESWVYGWWAVGVRPDDSFYFAFNWGLFAGFWSAYWGVRRLGAKVYSGGGQGTEGHVRLIQRLRPTVLLATPTYALRLAEAARGMGVDLAGSSIRVVCVSGEPGPCALPTLRRDLEEAYGARATEQLGAAELDAMAPACPLGEGVHMNEANTFSWSMAPDTGVEVGEGEVGENVVTTYVNNAQPLLNYRTHDLVRRYSATPCECGRTWAYLPGVVLGRSDHMFTLRGTNVYQTAVERLVQEVEGTSNYYQLVLTRDRGGQDRMEVRVEPATEVSSDQWGRVAERVGGQIRERIGVRMHVEVVQPGTLPRYELKTRRVLDQRPKEYRRELDR